jgi:hypothetical protein
VVIAPDPHARPTAVRLRRVIRPAAVIVRRTEADADARSPAAAVTKSAVPMIAAMVAAAAVLSRSRTHADGNGAADQNRACDNSGKLRHVFNSKPPRGVEAITRPGRLSSLIPVTMLAWDDDRAADAVFLRQPGAAMALGGGTGLDVARIDGDARPR